MSIFQSLQDLVGGAADAAQGAAGDVVEQASAATEGLSDAAADVTEQGQSAIEDITGNFGL